MEKIIWEVVYNSLPKVIKYCKKCSCKSEFASSQLFRVNANQKNLDIWLVYNCLNCKTSWNQALFSRAKTNSFPKELLDKFYKNDEKLAYDYTMNCSSLASGCFEVIVPDYSVIGDEEPLSLYKESGKTFELVILSPYRFDIKVMSILKHKLAISNNKLNCLIKDNKVFCTTHKNIKKARLQNQQKIIISL